MTEPHAGVLTEDELRALEACFHHGSVEAGAALGRWIGKDSVIETDSIVQVPLPEATSLLSSGESPVCFGLTEISGPIRAKMILAFDDASGRWLTDCLVDRPTGGETEWSEMSRSVILETTNILTCAYLNSLSALLSTSAAPNDSVCLLPTPPQFHRDFAESLLQIALIDQAIVWDHVILTNTRFAIDGVPVRWSLLFVPDAESVGRLSHWLVPRHGS